MANNNIREIHGRSGIITVCLTDPLSSLLDKIRGTKQKEPNAIGVYYQADNYNNNKHTVILFNVYDNAPVPWLKLGSTIELLLESPFVVRIDFYPLVVDSKQSTDKFRAAIVSAITTNSSFIHDKHTSYTILFMKAAQLLDEIKSLAGELITGYTIVNRIISLLTIKQSNMYLPNNSIITSNIIKDSVSITCQQQLSTDNEIKYVTEQSRQEITKLAAVFIDLFTTQIKFRNNVLNNVFDLSSLFCCEENLVSYICNGLQEGVISIDEINNIISKLSSQRLHIDNSVNSLITIKSNVGMVKVIENNSNDNLLPFQELLLELGICINNIIDNSLTVNLSKLISLYNTAIKNSTLQPIEEKNTYVSKNITMIVPGIVDIYVPTINRTLSMHNSNLSLLSKQELLDTLVYIDSLKDKDRSLNNRYMILQNEITLELAGRRK